jgi:hypothetical protein
VLSYDNGGSIEATCEDATSVIGSMLLPCYDDGDATFPNSARELAAATALTAMRTELVTFLATGDLP